jgi:hypothetical protein
MKFLSIIKILAALLVAYIFFHYGQEISYELQASLYESLRNTSAIIFGVMGIWIAVIYPNILSKIYAKNIDIKQARLNREEVQKISSLIYSLFYSSLIIGAVLIAEVVAPILKEIPFLINNFKFFRGVSYSFLGLLSIMQIWILLLALAPGMEIIRELDKRLNFTEATQRFRSKK